MQFRGKQNKTELTFWEDAIVCRQYGAQTHLASAPSTIFWATLFLSRKLYACDIMINMVVSCKQQHITLTKAVHMSFP